MGKRATAKNDQMEWTSLGWEPPEGFLEEGTVHSLRRVGGERHSRHVRGRAESVWGNRGHLGGAGGGRGMEEGSVEEPGPRQVTGPLVPD